MNEICCRFCGSTDTHNSVQVFKNKTKHLYIKCKDCRRQFYAPQRFIQNNMEIKPSKNLRREIKYLTELLSTPLVDD